MEKVSDIWRHSSLTQAGLITRQCLCVPALWYRWCTHGRFRPPHGYRLRRAVSGLRSFTTDHGYRGLTDLSTPHPSSQACRFRKARTPADTTIFATIFRNLKDPPTAFSQESRIKRKACNKASPRSRPCHSGKPPSPTQFQHSGGPGRQRTRILRPI